MSILIDRECAVCKEDALYYCRMCLSHFCVEHLCMHLSVAQEENSYTHREIEDESLRCRSRSLSGIELAERITIQDSLQPLESYSEEELQEQFNYYSNTTRRIRFELERRAVLVQSPEERASFKQYHKSKRNNPKQRSVPKGIVHATELVLNQIRTGNIPVGYVIARMNAFKK